MRAAKNFIAHQGTVTRRFKQGQQIPDDWMPSINAQSLVDEPLPHLALAALGEPAPEPPAFVDYPYGGLMDDVTRWVLVDPDAIDRRSRAIFAVEQESGEKGKHRSSLITQLNAYIDMTDNELVQLLASREAVSEVVGT